MLNTLPRHSALALLFAAACSAGPAPDPRPVSPITTVVLVSPCASGEAIPGCAPQAATAEAPDVPETPCLNGPPGPRCDGLLEQREINALGTAIDAAKKAVLDSQYRDVHALVQNACLQLLRDADSSGADGSTDAIGGLRNAQRAIAVDDSSAEARLALALALSRSFQGARSFSDPKLRELSLSLVDMALKAVPAASGGVGAATKTLEGYLALDRGQTASAKASFEAATKLHPGLVTAWIGLGDVARAQSDFDAAASAYKSATLLHPPDPGLSRAIRAAQRHEAWKIPAASAGVPLTLTGGSLAPPPSAVPKCPSPPAAGAPGASLCKGLTDLAKASTRAENERAARLVIDGWNELQPSCQAKDPVCGPHVAEALVAASHGYQAAGQPAKAIMAAKMVLSPGDLPGAQALTPGLYLEIGDRYFTLGIFDTAADNYARHLQLASAVSPQVAERALAIRIALGSFDTAAQLVQLLARNAKYTATLRANWILATAMLLRAVQGPEPVTAWLAPYSTVLTEAGVASAAADLAKPLEAAPAPGSTCASPLACAVKRLAGEAW